MNAKNKIAPSVLSADFSRLGEEIKAVESAGADIIHLDVMDGHFVPNITAGPILVEAARKATSLTLDTHLMITDPVQFIPDFAKAGANSISVHVEVLDTESKMRPALDLIKKHGAKAAIALNPATPLETIIPYLSDVDMILVMTVNPGFGGQAFVSEALPKVERLRKIITEKKLSLDIEVDGGIKIDNIATVAKAGANVFVAGSAIFKSQDYRKTIAAMKEKSSY